MKSFHNLVISLPVRLIYTYKNKYYSALAAFFSVIFILFSNIYKVTKKKSFSAHFTTYLLVKQVFRSTAVLINIKQHVFIPRLTTYDYFDINLLGYRHFSRHKHV
jgi:hypothetical protein